MGNSIMLKATREYSSRKSMSHLLVTNLAGAEIISTLFTIFGFVTIYLDYWPFGAFACKAAPSLQVLSLFVVTNTLAAIAVYRFVFIVFQVRITVSNCRLILFLSLLWLTALAVSMPLFVYHEKGTNADTGENVCRLRRFKGDDGHSRTNKQNYEIVRFILNFGLPYLIMVVSYGGVALKLKRHINRNKSVIMEMSELGEITKQTQEDEEEEELVQRPDIEATARECRKSTRAVTDLENDLLKMIYVVITVFAVCYLP